MYFAYGLRHRGLDVTAAFVESLAGKAAQDQREIFMKIELVRSNKVQ